MNSLVNKRIRGHRALVVCRKRHFEGGAVRIRHDLLGRTRTSDVVADLVLTVQDIGRFELPVQHGDHRVRVAGRQPCASGRAQKYPK